MRKNIDLNMAVEYRDTQGYALVVVKDSKVVYKSKSRGIYPLYAAYINQMNFADSSAADKVVGKGAAIFFYKLNIKRLDTVVISRPALDYLQEHDVVVSYAKLVDCIENRNRDGRCPVETIAENTSEFDTFLNEVEQFLKRLEII